MDSIRVYVPELDIQYLEQLDAGADLPNSARSTDSTNKISPECLLETLQKQKKKSVGFFDEELVVYVSLKSSNTATGKLTFELQYTDDKKPLMHESSRSQAINNLTQVLDTPYLQNENITVWRHSFKIKPGRNISKINVGATYKYDIPKVLNNNLKPFEEVNLMQIEGIDLLSTNCLQSSDLNDSITDVEPDKPMSLTHSIDLEISSLFKMSLKSYKSEKTLAWLDLDASKIATDLHSKIQITKVQIGAVNCEITPCNKIDFPVVLEENSHLTIVYYVLFDDGSTAKPLQVEIESIVDNYKHITTTWTSNLDLSNRNLTINHTNNSSSNLNSKKNGLLPAAKLSKLRSYNSLVSNKTIPKLPPPNRSSSTASISTSSKIPGNSVLGGKRYTSVKLKSGSNISLSQLWSDTASQNFQRGLVVTVTGPTRVKLGETFKWKIQLLNKSQHKMDLILYVQSSIKKEYEKTIPPIPIQSGNKNDVVPLFANNHLIRSFYYKFNRAGLVSLTNNLRVSLEYGNLYECELELMSLERGVFNIYDFKLLDVTSGDIFECNRLLDVMVT